MKWIDIKKDKPKKKGYYLCFVKSFRDDEMIAGWYNHTEISHFTKVIDNVKWEGNKKIITYKDELGFEIDSDGYVSDEVTHWMPLPEDPRK